MPCSEAQAERRLARGRVVQYAADSGSSMARTGPATRIWRLNGAQWNTPEAVIFDLDGTLVDTVERRIEAWLQAFEHAGIPASREAVSPLIGADGKALARRIAEQAGRTLDEDEVEEIDRRSGEIYQRLNVDPRPLPGARELPAALERAGIAWAIGTSSRREQVRASVEALGLEHEPTIVDGSHVKHAKPEP